MADIFRDLDAERKKEQDAREMELQKREKKVAVIENKPIPIKPSMFRKSAAKLFSYKRTSRPIKERLKIMRLGSMLEKQRLQNEIRKLKLQKQISRLRQTGKLKQIITAPIFRPQLPLYPAYATPELMGDIDSAFNADIGTGEDYYGGESYFGGEDYYPEDFFGNEFSGYPNNDPLYHLALKVKYGVSPLLW